MCTNPTMPSTTACKVLDDPGIVPSRAGCRSTIGCSFNLPLQALSSGSTFVRRELAKERQAVCAQHRTIIAAHCTKFNLSETHRPFLKGSIGAFTEIEGHLNCCWFQIYDLGNSDRRRQSVSLNRRISWRGSRLLRAGF